MNLKKHFIIAFVLTIVISCSVLFIGCTPKPTDDQTPTVNSLTLSKYDVVIDSGENETITATTDYIGKITAESSNTGIVSVAVIDKSIKITGKSGKFGDVTVTVNAGAAVAEVKVKVNKASSVSLSVYNMTIEDSAQSACPKIINANYTTSSATTTIVWSSSDPSIAVVESTDNSTSGISKATLVGKAPGKAVITATFGSSSRTCEVEVSNFGVKYSLISGQLWLMQNDGGASISGKLYIPDTYWYEGEYKTVQGVWYDEPTGYTAFENNKTITSIYIGKNVLCLSKNVFKNCSNVTEVVFSPLASLKTLASNVFENCTSLTSFEMPNSVGYFAKSVFKGCTSLERVAIATGLMTENNGQWEYGARLLTENFINCPINTIFIPSTVLAIDENVFSAAATFQNVYYGGTSAQWDDMIEQTHSSNASLLAINKANVYFKSDSIGTGEKET